MEGMLLACEKGAKVRRTAHAAISRSGREPAVGARAGSDVSAPAAGRGMHSCSECCFPSLR